MSEQNQYCQCEERTEMHPCPFEEEINGNDEDFCTCCLECTHNCAQEI